MNLKTKSSTEFFNTDYVNYASYDTIRKIPSVVDGQKNASRKILWFVLQKKIKNELKVSQMDSKSAEYCEYLHGSMSNVIVNLAQDYVGTNNINLLMPEGNFGTRLIPEASAARYIYTYGSNELFSFINPKDDDILEIQNFEGKQIEPKFLLPVLPLLLVNGAEGIASGYASKILPRNPKEIEKYIRYNLEGKNKTNKPFKNKPWYDGFSGCIEQGDSPSQWVISGVATRKANKVIITELPIGYSLKSYLKVLNKLEDDKVIVGYKDLSNETFNFEVQFNRKQLDSYSDEKLFNILKLRKKVTENYTVMSDDNRVVQLDSTNDIIQMYMNIKLKYLQKRKSNIITVLTQDIKELVSKYIFIKSVTDDELIISKRETEDVISDMDKIEKIIKIDGSYNYLLNMSIRSLTKERMEQLMKQIQDAKKELDLVKQQTIQQMWIKDLDEK